MTPLELLEVSESGDPLVGVIRLIRAGSRFVVTGHMSPDGDVLGSMTALAGVLRRLGKDVVIFNRDPLPERFRFLPLAEEFVTKVPAGVPFDAAFIVDCCDPERVAPGFKELVGGAPVVALDHHAGGMEAVDLGVHDPAAPAVGVLVYRLARALGVGLDDPAVGEGIYTSIVTDTGFYRYSNTNAEAHAVTAELLDAGVDARRVASALFEAEPLARVKLLAAALTSLELSHGGRVAWMVLRPEDLAAIEATPEMLDGVVDYGRRVRGVEVACLVRDGDKPGQYRVSLRSRGLVDVEAVAASLGGGGHQMAAGCRLESASLDATVARVRAVLAAALP